MVNKYSEKMFLLTFPYLTLKTDGCGNFQQHHILSSNSKSFSVENKK